MAGSEPEGEQCGYRGGDVQRDAPRAPHLSRMMLRENCRIGRREGEESCLPPPARPFPDHPAAEGW